MRGLPFKQTSRGIDVKGKYIPENTPRLELFRRRAQTFRAMLVISIPMWNSREPPRFPTPAPKWRIPPSLRHVPAFARLIADRRSSRPCAQEVVRRLVHYH